MQLSASSSVEEVAAIVSDALIEPAWVHSRGWPSFRPPDMSVHTGISLVATSGRQPAGGTRRQERALEPENALRIYRGMPDGMISTEMATHPGDNQHYVEAPRGDPGLRSAELRAGWECNSRGSQQRG
jgi:hypothetical protein